MGHGGSVQKDRIFYLAAVADSAAGPQEQGRPEKGRRTYSGAAVSDYPFSQKNKVPADLRNFEHFAEKGWPPPEGLSGKEL
jgi:hypothetical protein